MASTRTKAVGSVLAAALAISAVLVTHYEGVRTTAYRDMGGVWTICYGHTAGVREGDTATMEQCNAWRTQDLLEADRYVMGCIKAPLTAPERGALQDAVFNIGPRVVCGSTLQRKANAGQAWCDELLRWDYVTGRRVHWQTLRRGEETFICNGKAAR